MNKASQRVISVFGIGEIVLHVHDATSAEKKNRGENTVSTNKILNRRLTLLGARQEEGVGVD